MSGTERGRTAREAPEVFRSEEEGDMEVSEERHADPAYIGKADTPQTTGSGPQQPEIAEGPVEGLQPDETVNRGPWHPPLEVDPPTGRGIPRDAAGEPEKLREQHKHGGP